MSVRILSLPLGRDRLPKMTLRAYRLPLVLCLVLGGCFPMVCGPSPVVGQFGPYPDQPAQLRTASGEIVDVYRIKYWRFQSDRSALQIEYAFDGIADTTAVRQGARAIWPVFVAYVDSAGLSEAILTATALERHRAGSFWGARARSFGVLAHRDSLGRWYFKGDDEVLPPSEPPNPSSGIFQPDGTRVPLALGREEAAAVGRRLTRRH
jgi:hypothetical protein